MTAYNIADRLVTIMRRLTEEPERVIGEYLDLENQLGDALKELRETPKVFEHHEAVTIEEFCDSEGRLPTPIREEAWIETISRLTALDVRAILSPLPSELGLYTIRLLTIPCIHVHDTNKDRPYREVQVRVWVVPTAD